jgi:uncharacterized protein
MSGELSLETLLRTLSADLIDGTYVFVTAAEMPDLNSVVPRMLFREAEGISLILLKEEAEALGLAYEFPCRMITLNVHSSLEAVGFMARIATELAKQNMGVNPVAGFYHDHLFVPLGREDDALMILAEIASGKLLQG